MMFIFYPLALLLIYMSYRSLRGGLDYLSYFKKELSEEYDRPLPRATVIAPCKGADLALESNLLALVEQDYPEYEVVFVVDSENDPAVETIKRTIDKTAAMNVSAALVVANRAVDSSQKVENLREAVLHTSPGSKVFVFVDSDIAVAHEWLRHMVGPLGDESVGASTGYRWFVSDPPSFGSEMRSVWNASIASALGPDAKTNFCWGGSMALRRETFEELDIRSKWKGTLSDDFVVTRAIREANLSIHFIPRAISPSVGDSSLLETIEFTNRQMKITRVYSPDLWLRSLIGSFVFNFVMVTALLIVIFSSQNGLNVVFAVATLTLVSLFSVGKAHYRFAAVKLVLADRRPAVKRQLLAQYTLWLLTPALFLTNCVAASLSRRVAWRGIRYELKSPTETVIITD